jgi:hypothetical protein
MLKPITGSAVLGVAVLARNVYCDVRAVKMVGDRRPLPNPGHLISYPVHFQATDIDSRFKESRQGDCFVIESPRHCDLEMHVLPQGDVRAGFSSQTVEATFGFCVDSITTASPAKDNFRMYVSWSCQLRFSTCICQNPLHIGTRRLTLRDNVTAITRAEQSFTLHIHSLLTNTRHAFWDSYSVEKTRTSSVCEH